MQKSTFILLLSFISSKVLACADHFNTSVPHINDEAAFLNAVAKQKTDIKMLTLEEMLNGAATSPEAEQKSKFMTYYKKNVLSKLNKR